MFKGTILKNYHNLFGKVIRNNVFLTLFLKSEGIKIDFFLLHGLFIF